MPEFLAICFIVILVNMNINSYLQLKSLDNIANLISESKQEQVVMTNEQQQEPATVTYEEQEEEIVFVTREVQEDGDIIFEYGDVSDDAYFFVIINIEQGIYEYYWPAMCEDWPLEYDSLEELNESITCHIDQEWPNATFVMNQK